MCVLYIENSNREEYIIRVPKVIIKQPVKANFADCKLLFAKSARMENMFTNKAREKSFKVLAKVTVTLQNYKKAKCKATKSSYPWLIGLE